MKVLGVQIEAQIQIEMAVRITGYFKLTVMYGAVHLEDKMIAVVQVHPQDVEVIQHCAHAPVDVALVAHKH
jgi:hypothetical protein